MLCCRLERRLSNLSDEVGNLDGDPPVGLDTSICVGTRCGYRIQESARNLRCYGESRDAWVSTPGLEREATVLGIQLPVSLSFFRAALESGEVVIRWTTESETDNAGFNILRSHRKDGEYKQINAALIQGAGTTGERNTYKWVDLTAKTGVVYYYQVEDVSFAGERQVLTTSRLKGYVSVKNKLTTTWSELKSGR